MPGVMDIKHLLCNPCEPYSASPATAKTQEPLAYYEAVYEDATVDAATAAACTRDHYYWFDPSTATTTRNCRSNSVHSTLSCSSSSSSNNVSPLSLPLTLVRSRTASDASSATSESPRDWPAYPPTPRDDEVMVFNPYFNMRAPPVNPNTTITGTNISTSSTRYRVPSSRRSRAHSSSSSSSSTAPLAPVQTRMAWTPTEDDLLQQGYDEGLSWAMISATYLPHRSRGCCWGRFKTLQSKNLVDLKRQNARLFRRPWKAINGATKRH